MNQSEKKAPGNLIRKWAVVDAKDISRTETWLEEMAAQGLFFPVIYLKHQLDAHRITI